MLRTSLLPLLTLSLLTHLTHPTSAEIAVDQCRSSTPSLRARTTSAIYHAYNAYKHNALPHDELRPLTCKGTDTFGGLTITLVDTLDTLILLRDWPEFVWGARYLVDNLTFDKSVTVSVFETTIRVMGGLLSAHGFLVEGEDTGFDAWLWWPRYDDSLLYLAYQLAERLMPAFDTPTGIPFGAVHLQHGVASDESRVASTAGAGSLLLEFGTLSRYTGRGVYYDAALRAMEGLHERAAPDTGLVGNHIDIFTGEWVATESGIGGLIDSFYEYMLKGYILFGDTRLLKMYTECYKAVAEHLKHGAWYLDADMWTGRTTSLTHSALSAFFPGLQVLTGLQSEAGVTTRAHYTVWRRYGALPEGFDVHDRIPARGRVNYPLRPELVESVFYQHWATGDPAWVAVAEGVLRGLESVAWVQCGFARVMDVETHEREDGMDSFVIGETLKYVYLTLLPATHWSRSGKFVFTTEAHPLRIARFPTPTAAGMADAHRYKCGRHRRSVPCGFALPGRDIAPFDMAILGRENVAEDVVAQVERIVERFGMGGLDVGRLFVGEKSRYRVVKVVGEQVVFEQLARDARAVCGRQGGREVVKSVCRLQR